MATKTPTPIEALRQYGKAQTIIGPPEYVARLQSVEDARAAEARAALADVEALVVVLSKYPHQHDHRCYVDGRPKGVATLPVCGIPEALAKFQVES